jgi:hypothetical protein
VSERLAAGSFSSICPHLPARSLALPSELFGCIECGHVMQLAVDENAPMVCICCGQPGTMGTSWVCDGVVVWARMCSACGRAGNVIASPN